MHLYVQGSIIYTSQAREAKRCPSIDDWVRKMCYLETVEYLLAIVKTVMGPGGIMLSEINQKNTNVM